MRYFCFGLCILAVAAVLPLSSEFRRELRTRKITASMARSEADHHGRTPPANAAANDRCRDRDTPAAGARLVDESPLLAVSADEISELRETAPPAPGDPSASTRSDPVRHRAALHDTMITPGNFDYLGAFRPPHVQQNGTTFAYGGWCVAWRADGDPSGPEDGFPGSLFLTGHQHHQKVAEISIPVPVNSKLKRADDLSVAAILQPFADMTDGLLQRMTAGSTEPFEIGGLLVTNGLLHWTMYKYYNVANIDYPSHGISRLNLQAPMAEGPWHLGPMQSGRPEWHSYKHAGYIFEIPAAEANQWFGGRNLISGLQISTGLQASSQGPAMFAYALPPTGSAPNSSLPAVPLVWYSEQQPVERHHPADRWTGGAWLTLGDRQAVVIAGRKALGAFYYGEARPEDCTQDKGYHGPPYEAELLFYSPASLIHAASGSLPAAGLSPWFRWDGHAEGGGINQYLFDTCGRQLGGLAYDRQRNLLYLVQISAGTTSDSEFDPLPVIHVFRITDRN